MPGGTVLFDFRLKITSLVGSNSSVSFSPPWAKDSYNDDNQANDVARILLSGPKGPPPRVIPTPPPGGGKPPIRLSHTSQP